MTSITALPTSMISSRLNCSRVHFASSVDMADSIPSVTMHSIPDPRAVKGPGPRHGFGCVALKQCLSQGIHIGITHARASLCCRYRQLCGVNQLVYT